MDKHNKHKKKKTNININKTILEEHITLYIDNIASILLYVLLVILLGEIIVCTIVKMGYLSYYLRIQNNIAISYSDFVKEIILKTIIMWGIYGSYLILYKRSDFKKKKLLVCIVLIILTTIFVFGHWKYSYLSILYSIPVVLTFPLGKTTQKIVLSISLFMTVFYSLFQYLYFKTEYNFLISTVSITTLVTFYFICRSFYNSMIKTLLDMEKFFLLSTKLNDEIAHDFATGAFSKVTLHQDLIENKNFKTIAFIDLDNFKDINDSYGHSIGDSILKNIVKCFQHQHERIYRYGGDEFVVLSELEIDDFIKEIQKIQLSYNNYSKLLFSCNTTFSAGIMPINNTGDMENLLKKCDEVMYIAKRSGKNKLSVKK